MSSDSIPGELIRWMEVPGQPNVFALGNFARQVTFASQQTRAFNLIWALFRTNRLAPGQHVAVVGAGLAGMTATVAALTKGCEVDLFEQASQPCPLQRGNDIRFIHPNILRWPEEGSETAQTNLPFLNWTAANVRGVIKQIDYQWKWHTENNRCLRRYFNYKVNRLYASSSKAGPRRPWLSANRVLDGSAVGDETSDGITPGFLELSYDCVILAVGFGEERSVIGVPFLSYWENDSLHQETGRGRRSILVSGCGDGGLIDALRLRLRNFDHAEFVRDFLGAAKAKNLIKALREVDAELRPLAASPDVSLEFQAKYEKIKVPKDVERYFKEKKRADTTVTLNSPDPGPLTFRASLLNRYATYLAMRYADLHYVSGRITAQRVEDGDYLVTILRGDMNLPEERRFDLIIVRHGPQSVIRHLIPEPALTELEEWWKKDDDLSTKPQWSDDPKQPNKFWGIINPSPLPAEEAKDLALATFDSAYREFMRDAEVQSVAVGEYNGEAGFLVTLKPGAVPRQPKVYPTGVLVQYVGPAQVSTARTAEPQPPAQPSTKASERRVPVGVGIYNYSAQKRLNRKKPSAAHGQPAAPAARRSSPPTQGVQGVGTGTLGCFATDQRGIKYLISTSNVLTLDGVGKKDDLIFLEGEAPPEHKPIAELKNFKSIRTETHEGGASNEAAFTVDVAAARLLAGVQPDYGPLPPPWQMKQVGRAAPGNKVAKLGRTSGLTTGEVISVDASVGVIMNNSERAMLHGSIVIQDPEGKNFSIPGDGGAVIVRDDGTAVGLLFAGTLGAAAARAVTVACSLETALESLGLSLYPSTRKEKTTAKSGGGRERRRRKGAE